MSTIDLELADSEYDDDVISMEDDSDFDDFNIENTAPTKSAKTKGTSSNVTKKAKGKSSSSSSKSSALREVSNEINSKSTGSGKKGAKTVEQIYQKKTQLEHILLRPDTYIGSVERIDQPMFILDEESGRIKEKNITYTPGLYKIYDEILVNAADNKQRDPSMNSLEIMIDPEENLISVKNNGKGIPVVMHKEHDCYVPTLIFGHLLTGSNFDDNEEKTTGGRNGYGAKLANIFSRKFIVECVDSTNGLKFHQTFHNNMTVADAPIVKKCTATEKKKGDYTKITFSPDLERFKMERLDNDIVALLSKRAYDIAGSMANRDGPRLVVTLNGKKLPVKSFETYLKLYDGINPPAAYEQVDDRWEIGVGVSDGSFQQVSFVNAICTSKGGQHVNYIADQVASKLVAIVKKKNKGGTEIKASTIKNHLCIFVNCLINNPAFDSQTKENLTTRSKAFGSTCSLSEKFMKGVSKSGVIDSILAFAKFKQSQALKRQGGTKKSKLTGITKLDDANFAGTAKSKDCTLIITEGDSAKSLAMSGLSIVGRDYYGVFPLKGKPLNVREATHNQILKNDEIKNIVDIMGLKFGVEYDETSVKTLRYGHLMIMADQDHDGSHIKGLVINFVHHFWPSLLDVPGFLQQFITPIVKATKKKGKECLTFFTLPEYEDWKEATGNKGDGWSIKYYKGLGTSTSVEAKEYFSNLDKHEIHFGQLSKDTLLIRNENAQDEENSMDFDDDIIPDFVSSGSDLIKMAFSKKQVEDRKVWLNNIKKDTYLNYANAQKGGVTYSAFINKELILFSRADNQRSIPHLIDGFKPSQRKVLFSCLKRNLKKEIKVAQLAGYIGENSAYHHGEMSLNGAIVGMAQNFVGSNNINLLTPSGQFGTRRLGGKDAASPRYIFTKLEKITRTIFHPDDDDLLTYLNDDGQSIEPEYYMPVIPFVLVNGSDGIGTGWSSSVPNYNPREIIANIRLLIDGHEMKKLDPCYFGFNGPIVAETGTRVGSYTANGLIERTDDTTLVISELPLKKWTQDYKQFLEGMLVVDKKNSEPDIKDFKENHTDTVVSFTITATKEKIDSFEKEKNGLIGKFKLSTTVSTSNMTLFDESGKISRFPTPESMIETFYPIRLDFYVRRKELILKNLRREQRMLANKARFVEEVCEGDLIVSNRKRKDILADLKSRGYELFPKDAKQKSSEDDEDSSDELISESTSDSELAKGYEYLLGMKIWSLTFEKAEQLREQLANKTREVAELEATSPQQIWKNDLDAIEDALDEREKEMEAIAAEEFEAQQQSSRRQANKRGAGKRSKATKTVKKTTTTKKNAVSMVQKESINVSDTNNESVMKSSEAAKSNQSKTVAKKAAKSGLTKDNKIVIDSDSDSEDDIFETIEGSLMERLEKRLSITPKKQARKVLSVDSEESDDSKLSNLDSKKRPSPRELERSDSSEKSDPQVTSPAPKKSRKVPAKKSQPKAATKKQKPAKKPATKRRVAKKVVVESESESDDDFEVEEVASQPRSRSTRVRKVNYAIEIDSESDEDFADF